MDRAACARGASLALTAASRAARLSERVVTWLLSWGDRRSGVIVLLILTIVEATFFPAPTEALLLALCVSQPRRAWWFASLAAAGSVAGGIVGYQIGAAMFAELGRPVLDAIGLSAHLPAVANAYRGNAWLALVSSGYTPVPYMLYTMAAGAFALPLATFVPASLIGRALKYIPIAVAGSVFGPSVRRILARYAAWAGFAITALVVAAVLWRAM